MRGKLLIFGSIELQCKLENKETMVLTKLFWKKKKKANSIL